MRSYRTIIIYSRYIITYGRNEQGDAAFQKLINQYKEKKEYEKAAEKEY